uniref:Uncharacterized protein n=1 Tax=Arundo donax TaxID=35708 RepID=A0A0A9AQ44_ARUDO
MQTIKLIDEGNTPCFLLLSTKCARSEHSFLQQHRHQETNCQLV